MLASWLRRPGGILQPRGVDLWRDNALVATVPSRITHTDKFPARSNRGKIRTVVCSEDHIERGGVGATGKYYVPSGLKTYTFENGEPAAKIGDAFLDRSGEIYRRMTQPESLHEK